jgi:hypothetical protein
MTQTKALDALRAINQALVDGEARIKKQQEIIADHHLLSRDRTQAKAVLDVFLLAQAERERYRNRLVAQLTQDELRTLE